MAAAPPANTLPVLFVSERCPVCQEISNALRVLGRDKLVQWAVIERIPRSRIPPQVRSVPTMFLPDRNVWYVGKSQIMPYVAQAVNARESSTAIPDSVRATVSAPEGELGGFEALDPTGSSVDEYRSMTYNPGPLFPGEAGMPSSGVMDGSEMDRRMKDLQADLANYAPVKPATF
jgi:hypothetical protein